jgi:RNA polymerase sigma factor (sigma-70 family)
MLAAPVGRTEVRVEPWLVQLHQGHGRLAWDLFIERYRRLLLATIGRLVPDHDDQMDVFAIVCEELSANDFARLKRYSADRARSASVATWLVAVVRNLTIDWLRVHEGRRRAVAPAHLTPLQREIYRAVCLQRISHVEAYGIIQSRAATPMSFSEFLREARETRRLAPCPNDSPGRAQATSSLRDDYAAPAPDLDFAEIADLAGRMTAALASQPSDVRLAVELFVVERMPAADVARVVGWANGKAVYNRVSRALATLRATLEGKGIERGDLG